MTTFHCRTVMPECLYPASMSAAYWSCGMWIPA